MMTIFFGKSKELQFIPDNKRAWLDYLELNEGKSLVIQIDRETGVRSGNQNSWYWGVVLKTIADHTGMTENDLHEVYKRLFLPPRFLKYQDKEIKLPASTTNLNKIEFGEYIERIRAEASTMGMSIPDPKDDIAPLKELSTGTE